VASPGIKGSLQRQHNQLGSLRTNAADGTESAIVFCNHRITYFVDAHVAKNRHGRFGTHAAYASKHSKYSEFFDGVKAKQCNVVIADNHGGVDEKRLTDRDGRSGTLWHQNQVTDAGHLDNELRTRSGSDQSP
jgi:hypothetical protein